MSDELSQEEADRLLVLEKRRTRDEAVFWPNGGGKIAVPLVSIDGREEFMLDIGTSSIKLSKLMFQNRARTTAILVRLEIDGSPHRNPDDTEVPCPHIHLYREGFNDKWAFPVPSEHFRDLTDKYITLEDFMRFCHIVQPPEFVEGLL
jgi:hypothetical protein